DYLGLGTGATSTIKGARWTDPPDIARWIENVGAGRLGHEAETLSPKIRILETIMLRLRTTRGLRIKTYREMTGRDFLKDNKRLIHLLHRRGLMRIRNGYVRLTRNGMLVSNAILEHLFEAVDSQLDDGAE
ncbi:MAG: coproporphyrinogen III oxidase, partial [Deltaproteobacteria bacterium]|nr:coproporphyrinogen III oxidase [Deltaproteobacteria bacterium]